MLDNRRGKQKTSFGCLFFCRRREYRNSGVRLKSYVTAGLALFLCPETVTTDAGYAERNRNDRGI